MICHTGIMSQPASGPPKSPEELAAALAVDVRWPDDIGANAEAVNQVVISWDQDVTDMLYLYLGHVAPPPWLSADIAADRLAQVGNRLEVTPKGAFVLSRTRAEEIWTVLGQHLGKLPRG